MITCERPLEGMRILVAEDNAILAFDTVSSLRSAGAEVLGPVPTLKAALDLVQTETLTCAVLDVSLKDGFVFPAAQVLQGKAIGFFFYTSQDDLDSLQRDWPDTPILVKPAPASLLVRASMEACGR